MTSPTQRTLAKLRAEGWTAFVVERWNAYARIRQDLGGFGDVIAWSGDERGVLIVQATSGPNVAARITKIEGLEAAKAWLLTAGASLEVWGWRKAGERGARKTWQVRRVSLGLGEGGAVTCEEAKP